MAHGCRQIKNICASMNPNVHPPAKKQCVGGGTANDVSSDEERDDDSGDLVGMFNDVSSVENEDIEDNSGCNGEDNSLLGRQWRYCTSLDNFDPRALRRSAYFHIHGRRDASTEFKAIDFLRLINSASNRLKLGYLMKK